MNLYSISFFGLTDDVNKALRVLPLLRRVGSTVFPVLQYNTKAPICGLSIRVQA